MEKPSADCTAYEIAENLKEIKDSMAEACIKAGRRPEDVMLLGVTKTVPPQRINAAIAAGL
ncbi:MAG TPA: YggS family pyridoxal phosphate-dependent enzyme, partial [Ruminococcaceae bacterium]|nr:YggS family pyridoxal phosphate-dependent enzyme [Oscillospiraceae bacterium]